MDNKFTSLEKFLDGFEKSNSDQNPEMYKEIFIPQHFYPKNSEDFNENKFGTWCSCWVVCERRDCCNRQCSSYCEGYLGN